MSKQSVPNIYEKLNISQSVSPITAIVIKYVRRQSMFDLWTNQSNPPMLQERLVILDGEISHDQPLPPVLFDFTDHFFVDREPLRATGAIITVIPLHKDPKDSGWLQTNSILQGVVHGGGQFRLRYEDSPESGSASVNPDMYFAVDLGDHAPGEEIYQGNIEEENETKKIIICIKLYGYASTNNVNSSYLMATVRKRVDPRDDVGFIASETAARVEKELELEYMAKGIALTFTSHRYILGECDERPFKIPDRSP